MTKHKAVADVFCSDAGVGLMRIDSDIILNALTSCQAHGIATLPVHDSLIVPASKADIAAEIMVDGFAARFPRSSDCQVRIKTNPVRQMEKEERSLSDAA
jgi:hypothetical protein